MNTRPISAILIVVGTLSIVCIMYASTLGVCAIRAVNPPEPLLAAFKDVAMVALGALGAMLTSTRTSDSAPAGTLSDPVKVETTNTEKNPVITSDTHNDK